MAAPNETETSPSTSYPDREQTASPASMEGAYKLGSAPPIRCQLTSSDTVQAGDLIARGHSPVTDLCRELVAAGYDPRLPLECYRGDTVALRVRSIGEGAGLTVRETSTDGPRVVRWKPFPIRAVTAPVDLNGSDVAGGADRGAPREIAGQNLVGNE